MRRQHEIFHHGHIFTIGQRAIGHDVSLMSILKKFELGHKIIA